MATYSNSAREVEMPNGDVVVLHSAPTGGANTTSNIKKFKYDDNGHVTESSAANATDLNLSSYSTPTTGSTAIGTSDDIQTAIGKLDHQSHIDQTNILYGLNTGVKNLLTIKSTVTANGLTSVQQSDGYTVKITGTPTGGKSIQWSEVIKITESGTYKVKLTLSGTMASCYLYDISTSTLVHEYYSSNTYEETLTANHEYAMYTYSQSAIDATISAMLCTAAAYAQSPDYIAPALPNYDLTRLEAEDRAALAQEIDAGAKNMLQNTGTTTTISGVTFTVNSDGSVSTYGTSTAANITFDINPSFTFKSGTTYVLSGCPTGGSPDGYRLCTMGVTYMDDYGNGNGSVNVGDNLSRRVTIYIKNSGTNLGTSSSPKVFYPMVCTKAAFGVSSKFVPYRPNYDLVCDTVNKAKLSIKSGKTLTSGSLNDVINTMIANGICICFSAGTSDVSDKPAQGIFMHRTTMIDSTTAMQEVAMLTGENKGRMYVRTYATSVWTAWKETTNA